MEPKTTLAAHFSLERLFPQTEEASELLVIVAAHDYSASAIARAVEDCDAHILNLNILADIPESAPDHRLVALRIDHRNVSAVARSLERYGLRVIALGESEPDLSAASDPHSEDTRRRVEELLRYIEI